MGEIKVGKVRENEVRRIRKIEVGIAGKAELRRVGEVEI